MPLESRGAHFLIRSAQLLRGNTLRIGTAAVRAVVDLKPRDRVTPAVLSESCTGYQSQRASSASCA